MKQATLLEIVKDIRLEIGASPSMTQGISMLPSIEYLARRNQEIIYNMFNWPHLIIEADETLVPGQRYYSFNERLNRDRIIGALVKWSNSFTPVKYGFNSTIYNASMPEGTYRADPALLWRFWEGDQYEVWPAPANYQTMRWRFVRNLNPFLAPDDVSDVDATLIVLFTAAELLTKMKSPEAQSKNAFAQAHFAKIKSQMQRTQTFVFGGGETPSANRDWTLKARRTEDSHYVPVN
jgi:hypothetical protein